MKRLLRNVFVALGIFLIAYAASFAVYLRELGLSPLRAKIIWAAAAFGIFGIVFGLRGSMRARFRMFLLVLCLAAIEVCLQLAAWFGVLPGVNAKLKAPYGRVYWAAEGRGNSIRNRFGWHYPEFQSDSPRRLVVVGDSQVEAIEVSRSRNHAAVLNQLLRKGTNAPFAVFGLGSHGTCVAHSIEVLEYAARHYRPQEAIVVLSVGTDISEASPTLSGHSASQFPYYSLNAEGDLVLDPQSIAVRERFVRGLELSHRSLWINAPAILNSHCMMLQIFGSLRDLVAKRKAQAAIAARTDAAARLEANERQRIGFNPAPFALQRDAEAERAFAVFLAQVRRCKQICDANQMAMRLVAVPAFPKVFYDSQRGREWSMRIGAYHYLKPEREIAEFARSNGIPVLALGEYIAGKKLDVEEIRSLYLSDGIGHFSEKGHQLCAQAIYETFYRKSAP